MTVETIERLYRSGNLIRKAWSDGEERLCLLTALADDPLARPASCEADLAPRWLVYLLPWIDDSGTKKAWPIHVERLIACLPMALEALRDTEKSGRCRSRVLTRILSEATPYTSDSGVLSSCNSVSLLLERHGRGETVTDKEFASENRNARRVHKDTSGSDRAVAAVAAYASHTTDHASVRDAAAHTLRAASLGAISRRVREWSVAMIGKAKVSSEWTWLVATASAANARRAMKEDAADRIIGAIIDELWSLPVVHCPDTAARVRKLAQSEGTCDGGHDDAR